MKISLLDRSLYFKGLALLIRKDRAVGDAERALMMRVGSLFSYEQGFCREVIDDLLTNPHIVDEPPQFSLPEIARCFVHDGLTLSLADGELHDREWEWLQAVVAANGLDPAWSEDLRRQVADNPPADPAAALAAERFVWE